MRLCLCGSCVGLGAHNKVFASKLVERTKKTSAIEDNKVFFLAALTNGSEGENKVFRPVFVFLELYLCHLCA